MTPGMDDPLRKLLIELMGVANIEATCERLVNTVALAVAGKSDDIRAGAVDWLRKQAVEDLSQVDDFRGKNLAPLANLYGFRLITSDWRFLATNGSRLGF